MLNPFVFFVYLFFCILIPLVKILNLLLVVNRERLDEIGKKLKTEIDASSQLHMQQQMGRRQILGPAVGTTLNTITPCAACKLLRRRCAEECPFSPYFSPHEPQKFAAVHKVFGASNVSKLLLVCDHFPKIE